METNVIQISNYHAINLFLPDFNSVNVRIASFTSLGFAAKESVKVKILDNDGFDVARSGKRFITDVDLHPDTVKFCDSISLSQYGKISTLNNCSRWYDPENPLKRVDYSLECHWALTARLRGYNVSTKFFSGPLSVKTNPFSVLPVNQSIIHSLVGWCGCDALLEIGEEREYLSHDEDPNKSYDSSDLDSDDYEESLYDSDTGEFIEPKGRDRYYLYGERKYKICYYDPILVALKEYFPEGHRYTLLVIEYEGQGSIKRHEIRRVKESFIIDFFDDNDSRCCTVISTGSIHASAWDVCIHSDEGAYDSGLDLYSCDGEHHGIVLMGEQNSDHTFNYANALFESIIVPDFVK